MLSTADRYHVEEHSVTKIPLNNNEGLKLQTEKRVIQFLKENFNNVDSEIYEYFILLGLNYGGQIQSLQAYSTFSEKEVIFPIRESIWNLIKSNSDEVYIAHNHPKNSPKPSVIDEELTSDLNSIFNKNGLLLKDHFIYTKDGYYSFKKKRFQNTHKSFINNLLSRLSSGFSRS